MRIPTAVDAGFGQQIMKTGAAPMPGAPVMPDNSGAQIGEALQGLGKTGTLIAADQIRYDREVEEVKIREAAAEAQRQQREAELEAKHLAQAEQQSAAEVKWLGYQDYLTGAAQTIAKNPDLSDDQAKLAAFTETADTARSEFFKEIPDPRIQAQMAPHILRNTMVARAHLDEQLAKATADRIRGNQVQALESIPRSTRSLEEKLALIDSSDLSTFPAETQVKLRAEQKDKATYVSIRERFLTEDPRTLLEELAGRTATGDPVNYPWLDYNTRISLEEHAQQRIQQQDAERQRAARESAALLDQQRHNTFNATVEMVKAGYPIGIDQDVQLRKTFRGTQYEGLYSALVQKSNSYEFRQELLNKDPLTYYARQKGLNLPPIDTTRPLQPQLEARVPIAKEAQKALGLPFMPILIEGEIKGIGQQMQKLDGTGRANLGQILGAVYGPQGAGYIAAQLAGGQGDVKNNVLGLTVALAATGRSSAATLVGQGVDFLHNNKDLYDSETKKKLGDEFNKLAGSAWKGYRSETRDAYQQGVMAAYTALVKASGSDPKDFDKKLYQEAFKYVVGNTGYINGKTTVLPFGWNEDRMLNSLKQLTPEIVTRSGGVMDVKTGQVMDAALMAKRIRSEGSLWEAGNGAYYVQLDRQQLMSSRRNSQGQPVPFMLRFGDNL